LAQLRISKVRGVEPLNLNAGPITVGRSSRNDVVLSSRTVSRHHCVIELVKGVARIRDLDSSHGTIVNGRPVTKCELTDGDRIEIGRYTLFFASADNPDAFKNDRFALTTAGASGDSTQHAHDTHADASDEQVELLRADLAAMRRQLAALQIEYDKYVESATAARDADDDSRESTTQVADLQATIDARDEELDAMRGRLEASEAALQAAQQRTSELQEQVEGIPANDEDPDATDAPDDESEPAAMPLTGDDDELESKVSRLQTERDEFEEALAARETELAALQARLDDVSTIAASEHDEESAHLQQLETDLQARQDQVQALELELSEQAAAAEEQQAVAQSERASLQQRTDELLGEVDQLRQRLDARESDLTELRARLEETIESGKQERDALREQISRQEAERAELLEQCEARDTELAALRTSLDERDEAAKAEASRLREQISALESDNQSLRQSAGQLEATVEELRGNLDELEASSIKEITALQDEVSTIESEQEALRQERNRLERRLEKKRQKLDGAEATIEALRQRVAETESSLDVAIHADEDLGRTLSRFLGIGRQLRNASDQLAACRRDLQKIEAAWVKTDEQLDEAEQTGTIDAAHLARREAVGAKLEQASQQYEAAVRDLQDKVDNFARLAAAEEQVTRATDADTGSSPQAAGRPGLLRTMAGVIRRRG
jgi:chromosome segregation ATPase